MSGRETQSVIKEVVLSVLPDLPEDKLHSVIVKLMDGGVECKEDL